MMREAKEFYFFDGEYYVECSDIIMCDSVKGCENWLGNLKFYLNK